MKKIIIVLIVLLVLSLLLIISFHYRESLSPKEENPAEKEVIIWKTYQDEDYSFDINYLSDHIVEVKEVSDWCEDIDNSDCLKYVRIISNEENKSDLNIIIYSNEETLDSRSWVDNYYYDKLGSEKIEIKERFIERRDGVGFKKTTEPFSMNIFIAKDNYVVLLSSDIGLDIENEERFNQIVSTFRFSE
jgi:hypothetical protein